MPEVSNFALKPDPEPCVCGCGLVATLRVKKWKDGTQHVRGCRCPRCRGQRSANKGQRRQNKASVALGVPPVRHEEHLGGTIRREDKAGGRVANPVWTRFRDMERQSEAARPMGDNRPFLAFFHPDGVKDSICAFRLSQIAQVTQALYELLTEDAS